MNFDAFLIDNDNFRPWNFEHFAWLIVAIFSWCFWIWWGRQQKTTAAQTRVAWIMTLLPVLIWFYYLAIVLYTGTWQSKNALPLHLCYALNFVMPIMLGRRVFWLFEVTYFWVTAACVQALVTPDLNTAFPASGSMKYWPIHIGLVGSVLFAVFVYRWRPRYKGIYLALLAGNLFICVLHPLNLWIDSNFMYTRTPPPKSLLEMLGTHYLLWAEVVALVFFHIVFLPIWWSESRQKLRVF